MLDDAQVKLLSLRVLQQALERFHGNQTHAAKYLDPSRRTLIYRMEKYGIYQD